MRLDPQPRLRVNSTRRIRRSAANPGQLVPLPASIVERLREHSQRQLAEKLWAGSKWVENDLVFPNRFWNTNASDKGHCGLP